MIDQDHQPADALRVQEPFDAFFRRERRAVIGLAYALSGSRLACEDLAQEAFVAAYRRWDEIGAYDNPGAWVRRVVAHRAVSTVRRRAAEAKAVASLGFRRVRPAELPDEFADLWALVRGLPKRQAQAVALRYVEQLTPEEIAEGLGISRDPVYTHLRRAHRALAADLEEGGRAEHDLASAIASQSAGSEGQMVNVTFIGSATVGGPRGVRRLLGRQHRS